MVSFSKLITSQRGGQILVDTDGYPEDILSKHTFSLLPDKKKESYLKLANILLDKKVIILLDFEIGAVNAFKEVFPLAIIKLCYFHFCQNVYKNVCKKFKKEDPEFAKTSRLLACLPFVPIESIEDFMFVIFERTRHGGDYDCMIPIVKVAYVLKSRSLCWD